MTYNPNNQIRATIIRGKAKTDLDNLLPTYAKIIGDICPSAKEDFAKQFNIRLAQLLPENSEKTIDNHRTEIAGKLFGMYYIDNNELVHASERTLTFLENNDQPFFFKDICFKFQFPNGMDSEQTLFDKVSHKLALRQFPYILKLMQVAKEENLVLAKDEIAYYILNSLDVLQGKVSPSEVLKIIINDRSNKNFKKVEHREKATSYSMQHISEQLNILELANLIRRDGDSFLLNPGENTTIEYFAEFWNKAPAFDIYSYDLENPQERAKMYAAWDEYYAALSPDATSHFLTSVSALEYVPDTTEMPMQRRPSTAIGTVELGDEGEFYVFGYEKNRVSIYDQRLVNKIKLVSKTKGLGYDIQSVVAEPGDSAEFAKYLEVKATKRVTAPNESDDTWLDTVNVTRNEYIAAQQHGKSYFIYRVYFTSEGVAMFIIGDVYRKIQENIIKSAPLTYRFDFRSNAIDTTIKQNV